ISEYNVCGGMGIHAPTWSRIGFMVISILPALGIHLALAIARKDYPWIRLAAYGTALIWIILFGFTERIFANHACGGNYIIFRIKPSFGVLYLYFYYFWLLFGIFLNVWLMKFVKS